MMNLSASGETVRLTVAQAVIRYLAAQHSVADGTRQRLIPAALGIFGHGNVAGIGQALDQYAELLPFVQGRNEQALGHLATAFAKASRRRRTLAVTASIGPGAMNLITAAALATVNRLPLLLLPGDSYATRRQGPVLQQLEYPLGPDVSANDAFRPVSRFFDRITRPEQLLAALPAAMRMLTSPTATGAVVVSLPQDVQSHAFDFPVEFFAEREWKIRRPVPDPDEIAAIAQLIKAAERPLIIAGGGVHYSDATEALNNLAAATRIPVTETFGGKGAIQTDDDYQLGGIGLEGSPASNELAAQADLIVHIGTRLTDFATASQSLFADPAVRFASINVTESDAGKQGASAAICDARLGLQALTQALAGWTTPSAWSREAAERRAQWRDQLAQALDPGVAMQPDPQRPQTDAVLSQGQLIALIQEQARSGDTIIAAAGGPPGDLLKVWDATDGRHAHLEFGFSCMGYELPAALGVRLADPDADHRVVSFIGDGTFVMAPTELVTAAQEGLAVTIVISENHGFQVIRRLQMITAGHSFGNEFRYRAGGPPVTATGTVAGLDGGYLEIDLVAMAASTGAHARRAVTAEQVRTALAETRGLGGPAVIVVPTLPGVDLPSSGVWWDVAPAEIAEQPWVAPLRKEYEAGLGAQRWHG